MVSPSQPSPNPCAKSNVRPTLIAGVVTVTLVALAIITVVVGHYTGVFSLTGYIGNLPKWAFVALSGSCGSVAMFALIFFGLRRFLPPQKIQSADQTDTPKEQRPPQLFKLVPSSFPMRKAASTPFNLSSLPNWIRSRSGVLGTPHLAYYLSQNPKVNRDEMIPWSFQQRKFPHVSSIDTVHPQPGQKDLGGFGGPLVNEDGYACTPSAHNGSEVIFIPDPVINKIHPCTTYRNADGIYIGYYEDGKCIIQQPAMRACGFTALAMLLIDQKVEYDLTRLPFVNLSTTETEEDELRRYGYGHHPLQMHELEDWIQKNGSVFAAITANGIGNHAIIIDHFDSQNVTIRDPFHGWRIEISRADFHNLLNNPEFKGIKKLENHLLY